MILFVCLGVCLCLAKCQDDEVLPSSKEVNELVFDNEEEDRKVDWSEVKPSSVRAMTRRIDRLCQIIKYMDDTVAEDLMYLIEEEGENVIDHMRVYCMSLNNMVEFIPEYTNITVHFGKSLLDRGPPKWIPQYFEPKQALKRFNWTNTELDQMYELNDNGKKAYKNFAAKLQEHI